MTNGLQQILDILHDRGIPLSDTQLLAQFLATRDEASFATLVRRHGPMVIGVCRRILRDEHDAEDAFQAAFLILAQKASSVVKRESLSCWLYQVAYHAALEAGASRARRRARERPVNDVPHPVTAAVEAQDWRPLFDRELNALPEKYRAAILLCDLEGRTRKEAARQLRIPEGTLSSRLATAHKMLAKRLARCGLALSGAALAAAILEGAASAQVPPSLVGSTATAALAVAQQLAVVSTPAVLLMRGVLKAMLLSKLKRAAGALVILAALGAVGIAYSTSGGSVVAQGDSARKPPSELDALRKENELLKLNLQVVLEKVRAQEGELNALRNPAPRRDSGLPGGGGPLPGLFPGGPTPPSTGAPFPMGGGGMGAGGGAGMGISPVSPAPSGGSGSAGSTGIVFTDPYAEVEAALEALRESRDKEKQRQAAQQLDSALSKLKERIK